MAGVDDSMEDRGGPRKKKRAKARNRNPGWTTQPELAQSFAFQLRLLARVQRRRGSLQHFIRGQPLACQREAEAAAGHQNTHPASRKVCIPHPRKGQKQNARAGQVRETNRPKALRSATLGPNKKPQRFAAWCLVLFLFLYNAPFTTTRPNIAAAFAASEGGFGVLHGGQQHQRMPTTRLPKVPTGGTWADNRWPFRGWDNLLSLSS